jgi:hypothetical protein
LLGAISAETGIPPHVLEDTDWAYIDAISRHLRAKAKAASGDDDEIDWDETYGSE